ncbi:hypothetical protein [Cyanobium sp. ATX 6F1]|uniref:hypothetical protein n=1 Tax=Cyanobium sp. ATX 6F1 TaxID=2823702 RepID=UPI0020CFDF67|nr:hypothetical protein [Cyanobium sp. ATX 6F1]MCP9916187.1 hypothetical protein [Cyanobium sp. ATX 6F1]
MLPGLTTLARLRTILLALGLSTLLALGGCDRLAQPPHRVLLQALGLQIALTQRSIAEALALDPTGLPEVSRVRVEQQQALTIGDQRGLRLEGRFDWRLAGDPIRVDSPFELFLERGAKGQSWRLVRPDGTSDGVSQNWLTYPLPLPGERPG